MMFVLLRLAGYAAAFVYGVALPGDRPGWQWALAALVAAWGTWDKWKRPDDAVPVLRLGVWLEAAGIWLWALLLHDNFVLFLLASPLMRSCVHLLAVDSLGLGLAQGASVLLLWWRMPMTTPAWLPWVQLAVLAGLGPYAFVLGGLLRERDAARRALAVAAFEREQRSQDEERMRIASRLHDVMGQYWTAVIRGLDVALVTTGEVQQQFIGRSRETALDGLAEMRTAVHDWHDGRQTATTWLAEMRATAQRFASVVGVQVTLPAAELDLAPFADPAAAAEALARTVVESLTNAVRHGGATAVQVTWQPNERGLTLRVQDNGCGLAGALADNLASGHAPGLGTRSMQALAERCGGTWQITSGRGACVTLWLPYGPEKGAQAG